MHANGNGGDDDSLGAALDEAFILAPDWRLSVEDAHAIVRAHGRLNPGLSMRNYRDGGGWFDEVPGYYVATDKLKRLVAKRYLEARKAERG